MNETYRTDMAYLSPGYSRAVVVDPYYGGPGYYPPPPVVVTQPPPPRYRRGPPRRHYSTYAQQPQQQQATNCGYDDADDEGEMGYEGDDAEVDAEPEDDVEPEMVMPDEEGDEDTESQFDRRFGNVQQNENVYHEHIKAVKENPLSKKIAAFEKVRCNSCQGHHLLKDGLVDEIHHDTACSIGKNLKIGCDDCHKKEKVHHVHIYPPKPACIPPPEECDDDSSSDSESDCEEVDDGPVVEVYLEDCEKIGNKLLDSMRTNKPVSVNFNKSVKAKDGKSELKMNVAIVTSKADVNGKHNLNLSLTPIDEKGNKGTTISAKLWSIDLKAEDKKQLVTFNKEGAQTFTDAKVQQPVLIAAVKSVEEAFAVIKKTQATK